MNIIGEVEGKTCIVVDDMCDTAGSLVAGCKILAEHGAKEIYAAVSHGIFSKTAVELIEDSPIKEMVTTNTIPLTEEKRAKSTKIKQLSVAYMLAKTIESIQTHSPVSAVYELFND